MPYIAGFNMPGYLPESAPAEFEELDTAVAYIVEEARQYVDDLVAGEIITLKQAETLDQYLDGVAEATAPVSFDIRDFTFWVDYAG